MVWKMRREGKITASIAMQSFTGDISNPCKPFIKSILKYYDNFTTQAIKCGLAMEPTARKYYFN